jgi:tripartite-type tricarboxylate transporter receptor subunit TctC
MTPTLDRRAVLALLAGSALPALAQKAWPDKPIRLVLPFSAGGPGDTNVRAMALALGKKLGQTLIVDNKPGAGGIIGSDFVAKSAPDGYTLLSAGNGAIANALLRANMPYAESDLVPVVATTSSPSVMVCSATAPFRNLKEAQAYGKAKGGLNFGTAGAGSTGHFVAEMVESALGVPVTLVHYKSGSQTVNAIVGGEVDLASEAPIGVTGYAKSGRLRALALTAPHRLAAMNEVPTTTEQGFPAIQMQHWGGMFAPKGTSATILDRIAAAVRDAYASDADLVALTERGGGMVMAGTRAEFEAFLKSETARLGKIVAQSGMKLD